MEFEVKQNTIASKTRQVYTLQVFGSPLRIQGGRNLFLSFQVKIERNQYDPSKPNYVSPVALAETSDDEFCLKYAKVPVNIFNQFLKTL